MLSNQHRFKLISFQKALMKFSSILTIIIDRRVNNKCYLKLAIPWQTFVRRFMEEFQYSFKTTRIWSGVINIGQKLKKFHIQFREQLENHFSENKKYNRCLTWTLNNISMQLKPWAMHRTLIRVQSFWEFAEES